jgi:hypothetical protein
VCSIAIVLSDGNLRAAGLAPALIIAASGFWVARASGRSRLLALVVAVAVLVVGIGVAVVKSNLVGH